MHIYKVHFYKGSKSCSIFRTGFSQFFSFLLKLKMANNAQGQIVNIYSGPDLVRLVSLFTTKCSATEKTHLSFLLHCICFMAILLMHDGCCLGSNGAVNKKLWKIKRRKSPLCVAKHTKNVCPCSDGGSVGIDAFHVILRIINGSHVHRIKHFLCPGRKFRVILFSPCPCLCPCVKGHNLLSRYDSM